MRSGPPWPRLRTLRARVTLVASLAITAGVVLGFLLLYVLYTQSVHRTVDGQLRTYATQVEQSAVDGVWPGALPPSSLDSNALAQVLAPDGEVLAASRALTGLPALYDLPAGSPAPVRQPAADGVVPAEVQVVAVRATVHGRPVVIVAGTDTRLLRQLNTQFATRLLLGIPVTLLLAALSVWLIVGRALRPVEHIRRAVTEISSADLSRRVPEPGTADEIGQLARTMNDMLLRLEGAARRQRRFVADASHELRSPLAAIRTTLEVGLAHPDRAPWPVIAERAAQQSARLEVLIGQLLLLAKSDERQLAGRRQRVDLRALLAGISSDLPAHHVSVDLDVAVGLATTGDPGHLERLFRNVLDNAVRYAGTRVHITARSVGGLLRVRLDDDGPGIPFEDRERVFGRFVRLDDSRERRGSATGLGLAIAREIARAHQGRIGITAAPGGGTRVVVTLPEEGAAGLDVDLRP